MSGDIIHVEPLVEQHVDKESNIIFSFTKQYFIEKNNKIIVNIEEPQKFFERRKKNTKEKETDEANCNFNKLLDKWEDKKINLTISTNKKYTFLKLKESISLEIGIEPRRFRIFKKEHNTNLKLLKDNTKILEELLKVLKIVHIKK